MYPLVRGLASDGVPVTATCRVLKITHQPSYQWLPSADSLCVRLPTSTPKWRRRRSFVGSRSVRTCLRLPGSSASPGSLVPVVAPGGDLHQRDPQSEPAAGGSCSMVGSVARPIGVKLNRGPNVVDATRGVPPAAATGSPHGSPTAAPARVSWPRREQAPPAASRCGSWRG